jgi:YVTN family beta-propeller protein
MNFSLQHLKWQIFLMTALFAAHHMYAGYIGNNGNNIISILNTQTNSIPGIVNDPLALLDTIYYIAFTPDGKTAYAANATNATISYIDVATNTVQGNVAGGSLSNVNSLAITPDGTKLYAIGYGSDSVYVIDTATNTFLHNIVSPFNLPSFMVITPDGTTGYITDYGTNTIKVVDIATDTVTTTITDASIQSPYPLALTPDGSTLYIGNYSNMTITIINVATNAVIGTIMNPLLSEIDYLAITPDGKTAYISNATNGNVAVVNLSTKTVSLITNLSFNQNYYLAISNDGKTVYVANNGANSVTIINTATNTVTGTVQDPQSRLSNPYPIALFAAPYPPRSVSGCRFYNRFLTQVDIMNVITWTASYSGSAVTHYLVYRDAGLLNLAGRVPATGMLQFVDHNQQNIPTTYYIVAVNASGNASQPVSVTVTQNCNS